jgi:predicted helicase
VNYFDLWGLRRFKYEFLSFASLPTTAWSNISPESPFYFFVPQHRDLWREYERDCPLPEVFGLNSTGITTSRDDLVVDIDEETLVNRMTEFIDPHTPDQEVKSLFHLNENYAWRVSAARTALRGAGPIRSLVRRVFYRPFDARYICYDPSVVWRPRENVMSHLEKPNLALMSMRRTREGILGPYLVVSGIVDRVILSSLDNSHCFPLYLYEHGRTDQPELVVGRRPSPPGLGGRKPNLKPEFVADLAKRLGFSFVPEGKGDLQKTLGPEDVFDYIYAVFHSPAYRTRYADFLKSDFPRVPLTSDCELFRSLCGLGAELVALHLLESPKLVKAIARYPVTGLNIVEKGFPKYLAPGEPEPDRSNPLPAGRVYISKADPQSGAKGQYFEGVPPEVWKFHIGGYQVCEKWLKDRRGRTLTYDDLEHYCKVVTALSETIRLMAEIDAAIPKWPIV